MATVAPLKDDNRTADGQFKVVPTFCFIFFTTITVIFLLQNKNADTNRNISTNRSYWILTIKICCSRINN